MKTKIKKFDAELYNIFCDVFPDDKSREVAIRESKIAYSVIKQDALFRTMPNTHNEMWQEQMAKTKKEKFHRPNDGRKLGLFIR